MTQEALLRLRQGNAELRLLQKKFREAVYESKKSRNSEVLKKLAG
ncbi:hypothetical protein SAMN04487772_10721 [[Clostridium] polysaccharolyticum]|jgi:hypothetical protein|uniref:Uncharacterized protein n=1 Tax=[Clostridium] polysaccharolyticum TaxID=29364 RepID=A0A1I0B9Q4_9FIRM|nr:hypothetical protein SAMN04487772_10721 [[Clostridium] polysaccharolyticum]